MIRTNTGRADGRKALVSGVLLAAMLLLAAGEPAHGRPVPTGKTFTVNQTGEAADADLSDNVCDTNLRRFPRGLQCTLRAAIEESNDTPGADTINFAIPGDGPHTIALTYGLPDIKSPVKIDGYTQGDSTTGTTADDAAENTATNRATNAVLKIVLDGQNRTYERGLFINDTAPNTVIRGLVIKGFDEENGIEIVFARGVRIEGNFIGTNATGAAAGPGNGDGVMVLGASGTTIGGTTPAARNLISGNNRAGISIGPASTDNFVQGNLIGTKKDGASDLGNGKDGVVLHNNTSNFTIGGTASGAANTIAFNGKGGDPGTDDGVRLHGSGAGNRVLGNSIFSNVGLGINLQGGAENASGATANDPLDPDAGPNDLQNKPRLGSATTASGGSTTVGGNLNSVPNRTFTLQFFSNAPNTDEGKTFRGQTTVTTNANGNASFTFVLAGAVPAGQTVTATATGAGGTSEFSAPRTVVAQ